jgi:hypothetical protein
MIPKPQEVKDKTPADFEASREAFHEAMAMAQSQTDVATAVPCFSSALMHSTSVLSSFGFRWRPRLSANGNRRTALQHVRADIAAAS